MALRELQSALAALVVSRPLRAAVAGGDPSALDRYGLAPHEGAWLRALVDDPGFRFTCSIQRSWCAHRTLKSVPLTTGALPPDERRRWVDAWLDRGGGRSSFFADEGTAFLDFLLPRLEPASHAASLCRFERAMLRAEAAHGSHRRVDVGALDAATRITAHPDSEVVEFHAPPLRLIEAALAGHALPPAGGATHPLLVAPGLPGLVRSARPAEVAMLARGRQGATLAALRALDDEDAPALDALFEVGALVPEGAEPAAPGQVARV